MIDAHEITHACDILRAGGVIACPTESFVGLLADASNPQAIDRIISMKGRAPGQAIAIIVPDLSSAINQTQSWTPLAAQLASRYWPGPLTMILEAKSGLDKRLLNNGRIGIRVPGPSVAAKIVRAFGAALTSTSANPSGHSAVQASDQLHPHICAAVDLVLPGRGELLMPSTLVDATGEHPKILRAGSITLTES